MADLTMHNNDGCCIQTPQYILCSEDVNTKIRIPQFYLLLILMFSSGLNAMLTDIGNCNE